MRQHRRADGARRGHGGGLLRTIAAQGYVTLRVEKSGVGDSKGPACDTIGYTEELDGYRAALTALKRHPSVDTEELVDTDHVSRIVANAGKVRQ